MVVNPQKTNTMIFTKKCKPESVEPLRFYSSMCVCRRAMGKTLGINPKMNKAILLPILLYAAVVWWPMVSRVQATG